MVFQKNPWFSKTYFFKKKSHSNHRGTEFQSAPTLSGVDGCFRQVVGAFGSILEGNSVVDGTVVRVVWRFFYLKKKVP